MSNPIFLCKAGINLTKPWCFRENWGGDLIKEKLIIKAMKASKSAIEKVQKAGGVAAFIDVEHALDSVRAEKIGVDLDNLLISQPDYGEQALEIVESLIRSGKIDVVVIDSVAALTPKDEIEGDVGAHHMGKQARLMSQALRKMTAIVAKSKTVVIFINILYMSMEKSINKIISLTDGHFVSCL